MLKPSVFGLRSGVMDAAGLALLLLAAASTAFSADPPTQASGMHVTRLRCEYLVNPLGIDAIEPRLSWTLESREPRSATDGMAAAGRVFGRITG